jgi:hypothetical protein
MAYISNVPNAMFLRQRGTAYIIFYPAPQCREDTMNSAITIMITNYYHGRNNSCLESIRYGLA